MPDKSLPDTPKRDKPKTAKSERDLDESLDESFPASDPPSQTDPTHGIKHRPPPPKQPQRK